MLNALSHRVAIPRLGARRHARTPRAGDSISVSREVLRFVAGGLLAAAIIAAGGFFAVSRMATSEAITTAETLTQIYAHDVVQPWLTPALLKGDPSARSAIDDVVRHRVIGGRVIQVKIWSADGLIVYSNAAALVGQRYPLGVEEREALASGQTKAEDSDLSKPENKFERSYGKLLEVYLPIGSTDGTRLLFETYQPDSAIQADQQRVWGGFFPALVVGLILLFAVQVPLAWRLARRLERSGRGRAALLERAISSSDAERRRIAGDLHDGPVQNLTAVSLTLSAAVRKLTRPGGTIEPAAVAETMSLAAQETRVAMTDLRSLIVEIAPTDLNSRGLKAVLERLLDRARSKGLAVGTEAPEHLDLPADRIALIYRVAQESVRNVVKHAAASSVHLTLRDGGEGVTLEVRDDGKGFSPDQLQARRREGHVGLSLLHDRVAEAGAVLTIDSIPGHGTCVRLELPNG